MPDSPKLHPEHPKDMPIYNAEHDPFKLNPRSQHTSSLHLRFFEPEKGSRRSVLHKDAEPSPSQSHFIALNVETPKPSAKRVLPPPSYNLHDLNQRPVKGEYIETEEPSLMPSSGFSWCPCF